MISEIEEILKNGYEKRFKTEQIFRSLVVDRLIERLGWDLYEDVDQEAEIPAGSTTLRADYIVGANSHKFAIEVKNPSVDIVNNRRLHQQLSAYLRLSREVEFGLLYNGKNMLFMDQNSENPVPIWHAGDSVKNIVLFSKGSFPRDMETLLKMPSKPDLSDFILHNRDKISESIFWKISEETGLDHDLVRKNIRVDISINKELDNYNAAPSTEISGIGKYKNRKKPAKIKKLVIGGRQYFERNANQVLIKTAEWLIDQGRISKDTKVLSGSSRYILNDTSRHPDGTSFFNKVTLKNGMFLEVNNAHDIQVKYARKLLEDLGYNPKLLEVEWE